MGWAVALLLVVVVVMVCLQEAVYDTNCGTNIQFQHAFYQMSPSKILLCVSWLYLSIKTKTAHKVTQPTTLPAQLLLQ